MSECFPFSLSSGISKQGLKNLLRSHNSGCIQIQILIFKCCCLINSLAVLLLPCVSVISPFSEKLFRQNSFSSHITSWDLWWYWWSSVFGTFRMYNVYLSSAFYHCFCVTTQNDYQLTAVKQLKPFLFSSRLLLMDLVSTQALSSLLLLQAPCSLPSINMTLCWTFSRFITY